MIDSQKSIQHPETAEQKGARLLVEHWARTGPKLEAIRRREIRERDNQAAIGLLCGPADYTKPPYAPKPTSEPV